MTDPSGHPVYDDIRPPKAGCLTKEDRQMRATIMVTGLLVGLAGVAVIAQTMISPKASRAVVPETATGEIGEGRAVDMSPRSNGGEMDAPDSALLETYDMDGNGIVTQTEIQTRRAERITQAESDRNGALSSEELVAIEEVIHEEVRRVRALVQTNEAYAPVD